MLDVAELTKQLISIPSWVGTGCDEKNIGAFIYEWLQRNTNLQVIKQPVKDGRFNVIATDGSPTRTVLVGHMDTVEPRAGWTTDPWTPIIKNDRLYGLGATDMKGSLAAGMVALADTPNSRGVMFLAYCDEEYDFAGMRAFIGEYQNKIQPETIYSLDGSAGQVGIGCRGLIEVSFRLRGKSGHAGRPEAGVNAIVSGVNCLNKLKRQLTTKYSDPALGPTSLNLAYCQGGLDTGSGYGRRGNNIADLAEFVLDIRPANSLLTADRVNKLLLAYAKSAKLTLENWTVRHDLGSWITLKEMLIPQLGQEMRYEPSLGYIDTQMLWETFGRVPCATIGAGNLALAHKPNEYVEIEDLDQTRLNILQIFGQVTK